MLNLFTIFHLNLAYSSIEEDQRMQVIKSCYWPLLHLAHEYDLPLGIEAPAYTLEVAADLDPGWLNELRRLTIGGPCEFIGSGYAQIIGPLAPAEINAANLRLGHQVYGRLLGFRPQIALINEQAYSAGLMQHYIDAGYKAIVMEWDNPALCHPEWDPEWRYLPQIACGQHDEEIPVIWNNSITFQKFQRYAHSEMELDEYIGYLRRHLKDKPRTLSIYSNDVEIFDFRPGRYHTEAVLEGGGEWRRIGLLIEALMADGCFRFLAPSEVLKQIHLPGGGNRLHLESAQQPIPVKKQGKYNITRWAVTGRDNIGINTACWRIYETIKDNPGFNDNDWQELCYLWSSDFRTHITDKRWADYKERLALFSKKVGAYGEHQADLLLKSHIKCNNDRCGQKNPNAGISRNGHYLTVETQDVKIRLNCRRGLAFDGLWFKKVSDRQLMGTLHHGYYDDISLGADFYTGHLIMESPGQPKITDLNPAESEVASEGVSGVIISGAVQTPLGPVYKAIRILNDSPCIELEYRLGWETIPAGFLRVGHITLNPEAFDRSTLFYHTHNGGYKGERFYLAGATVDHGSPVSFLVSASHGIGITYGVVELGDEKRSVCIEVDKTKAALIGLITYREVGNTYFCRLGLSVGETDETRSQIKSQGGDIRACSIRIMPKSVSCGL